MEQANKATIADLRQRALDHYDNLATDNAHWNSVVADAIEAWNPWRSVDDPPDENKIVMVYNPSSTFETGKIRLMYYRKEEGFYDYITHWKEKPEAPDQ